jgi:multidrug efflux pump subunit AcrB
LVIAYFPGASSAQVEDQVTNKLEEYLFQFEEVRKGKTYSTTQDGLVVVNVELNQKVKAPDEFWNKLRHQLLVARQIDFPAGVRGPVVNSDFGDTEAMIIGVESDEASYEQLKEYAETLEDLYQNSSGCIQNQTYWRAKRTSGGNGHFTTTRSIWINAWECSERIAIPKCCQSNR